MVTIVLISLCMRKKPKLRRCAGATIIIQRLFNIQPRPEFDLTEEALKLAKDLGEQFKGWCQQSS